MGPGAGVPRLVVPPSGGEVRSPAAPQRRCPCRPSDQASHWERSSMRTRNDAGEASVREQLAAERLSVGARRCCARRLRAGRRCWRRRPGCGRSHRARTLVARAAIERVYPRHCFENHGRHRPNEVWLSLGLGPRHLVCGSGGQRRRLPSRLHSSALLATWRAVPHQPLPLPQPHSPRSLYVFLVTCIQLPSSEGHGVQNQGTLEHGRKALSSRHRQRG